MKYITAICTINANLYNLKYVQVSAEYIRK